MTDIKIKTLFLSDETGPGDCAEQKGSQNVRWGRDIQRPSRKNKKTIAAQAIKAITSRLHTERRGKGELACISGAGPTRRKNRVDLAEIEGGGGRAFR